MKKVYAQSRRRYEFRVYRNEYGEYVVRLYDGSRHLREADYFTDDKADAIGTGEAELERMHDHAQRAA